MRTKGLIFLFIIALAGFLRFWQLGEIPPGLNIDEVSEGYNAYSLLETGKDRYGMVTPVIFKSFGSYQPPIYTYLTVLPILIFGPTIFAVKAVTAISGLIVVIFTFLIVKEFLITKKDNLALVASLVVAISPWAIFFSRMATEANPALALFIVGFYLSLKSISKAYFFPLAALFFGLATHAYYSERIISLLFLGSFVFIFRKKLLENKKWLIFGLIVYGLTQIPHLAILKSGAFGRRLEQVTYFGRDVSLPREFASQYLAYFSPRNLFFDPDDQGARSMPDLSVFYSWMVIPYFFGLAYLIKKSKDYFVKNLLILLIVAPIPVALTTDPFYTLRIFVLLWTISIVISLGLWQILDRIKLKYLALVILLALTAFSLTDFYLHYFVLYKSERSETVKYSNLELIRITQSESDKKFVVDLSRDISIGLRFAFFRRYDPYLFQKEIGQPFLSKYYTSVEHETAYKIDNVEIRPINWGSDVYKDLILVGDTLAISQDQVAEHKLKLEFEIKDLDGEVSLIGYSTNPEEKCRSLKAPDVQCK